MIPSLCWVAQGVSTQEPHVVKLDPSELNNLIEKTQENLNIIENPNEENSSGEEDEIKREVLDVPVLGAEDDEFNMAEYDNEDDPDGQKMFGAGLTGVTYFPNPEDDPYITLPSAAIDEDDSNEIKPNDNLICCAKLDGEMSSIEVHLWNAEGQDFYVHHDILLDKYPLSLEWLSFDAGDQEEVEGGRIPGNYVALGCMSPQIEVWDLDIINTSEPVAVLGERLKTSKKKPKVGKKGHSSSVLDLSWNRHTQNILASASADCSILLWDLESGSAKECLCHHTDKVCSSMLV